MYVYYLHSVTSFVTATLQASLLFNASPPYTMLTFKTKAFRLVSNVQCVKCLLLLY